MSVIVLQGLVVGLSSPYPERVGLSGIKIIKYFTEKNELKRLDDRWSLIRIFSINTA
jgi:hypothetical protein